jgi:hypothetical protein
LNGLNPIAAKSRHDLAVAPYPNRVLVERIDGPLEFFGVNRNRTPARQCVVIAAAVRNTRRTGAETTARGSAQVDPQWAVAVRRAADQASGRGRAEVRHLEAGALRVAVATSTTG